MMMKKIVSGVLSFLLILSAALFVSAEPAMITQEDITIKLNLFSVDVTVKTAADSGRMTAQIRNKDDSDVKIYGVDEDNECDPQEDGTFLYFFHFKMPAASATGTYIVKIDNAVAPIQKEFPFVNVQDKIGFYNALNAAPAKGTGEKTICDLLYDKDCKTTYDLTIYRALSDEVRILVDEKIEALDLTVHDIDGLEAAELRFTALMDESIALAKIADITEAAADDVIREAIDKNLLDGTFYILKNEDGTDLVPLKNQTIIGYMHSEMPVSLELAELSLGFDRAVLLSYAQEMDYASFGKAFRYYLEKGTFSVNKDNFKTISDKDLDNNFFKALKKENNTSTAALKKNADDLMEDLLSGSSGSGSGSGGSSGSGSSGSSSGGNRGNTGLSVSGESGSRTEIETNIQKVSFSDMDSAPWANAAVDYLAGRNIVSGRGDGRFCPNDKMSREEFVKLVVSAFSLTEETAESIFEDVEKDRWSYPYIASAVRAGIINGVDEMHFHPTGSITREDMAVIIFRAYKLMGLKNTENILSFTDADEISGYAKEAVGTLCGSGILNGMGDGTFAPRGEVTRAQASKVVYELLIIIGGGGK